MISFSPKVCGAAAAGIVFALLWALPAVANSHNGAGVMMPPSHSIGQPSGRGPDIDSSVPRVNPNGPPPIGKPAVRGPDTDRGMSEGKGRTDSMHTSMSRAPINATLTALTRTTATVRLSSGAIETFAISGDTFSDLRGDVGKQVVFRTSNGTLIPFRDNDRGMSERKGRTDSMHTSMSRAPINATLIALTRTTATVRLSSGAIETFAISGDTFSDLGGDIGKHVVFRTRNGTLIPVTQR
jgi:hypothetical protein